MMHLSQLLSPDVVSALTGTLLHSLWQGVVAALVLYAALAFLPAHGANARYWISVGALIAVVICALVTWNILSQPQAAADLPDGASAPAAAAVVSAGAIHRQPSSPTPQAPPARTAASVRDRLAAAVASLSPWLAATWAAGVVIMLIRATLLLKGAATLRRSTLPLAEDAILAIGDQLRRAMGLTRGVRIAVSEAIAYPAVVGILEPLILLPSAIIAGVPAAHLKAIIAHELAHVRRRDSLVNLFQMFIEALGFFNPSVWWVSRRIRIERETCCDAVAAAVTGEPTVVARALADSAEIAMNAYDGTAALAFAREGDSSLVDRVRRLLFPSGRPSVRLSWLSLAGMLVAGFFALAVLSHTVGVAVKTAAKFLTPEERVEKLTEVVVTHGSPPDDGELARDPATNVTVSGTVRTWDSQPLPRAAQVSFFVRSRRSSLFTGMRVRAEGTYSMSLPCGEVFIAAFASGYAPAIAGPLIPGAGEAPAGIDLVLTDGFTGPVKVVDESGAPVEGADLSGDYDTPCQLPLSSASTGSDGTVSFEHLGDMPLKLRVTAAGFQYDERTVSPAAGTGYVWKLARARPTTGVVVSNETGAPVEGATIRLLSRQKGDADMNYQPDESAPLLAATDRNGRFTLTTLRDDSVYAVFITAPDKAPEILDNIRSGAEGIVVKLDVGLHVRGLITGPLKAVGNGDKAVRYRQPYRLGNTYYEPGVERDAILHDGVGSFELKNLRRGSLMITVGEKTVSLDLVESVNDMLIDLTPPGPDEKPLLRPVEIRFVGPAPAPVPRGTVRVSFTCQRPGDTSNSTTDTYALGDDGLVRFEVAAPGRLYITPEGMIGYWFRMRDPILVPAGTEPLTVNVPCVPAGAVYGTLLNADGTPAEFVGNDNPFVSVIVAEKAPSVSDNPLDIGEIGNQPGGRFMVSPLPLGGVYVVVAKRHDSYVVSEPLRVDEAAPLREITLRLVDGLTVDVRVLTPDGAPAPDFPLQLGYEVTFGQTSHGFGGGAVETDREGRVPFEHVNPAVPGNYRIVSRAKSDWRPVSLKIDPTAGPFTIRLERGRILTGRVVNDETTEPVIGAEVYAWYSADGVRDSCEAEAPTDPAGAFRFSNLGDHEYTLGIREYHFPADAPHARPGQAQPSELRVIDRSQEQKRRVSRLRDAR